MAVRIWDSSCLHRLDPPSACIEAPIAMSIAPVSHVASFHRTAHSRGVDGDMVTTDFTAFKSTPPALSRPNRSLPESLPNAAIARSRVGTIAALLLHGRICSAQALREADATLSRPLSICRRRHRSDWMDSPLLKASKSQRRRVADREREPGVSSFRYTLCFPVFQSFRPLPRSLVTHGPLLRCSSIESHRSIPRPPSLHPRPDPPTSFSLTCPVTTYIPRDRPCAQVILLGLHAGVSQLPSSFLAFVEVWEDEFRLLPHAPSMSMYAYRSRAARKGRRGCHTSSFGAGANPFIVGDEFPACAHELDCSSWQDGGNDVDPVHDNSAATDGRVRGLVLITVGVLATKRYQPAS
ncbi:hypothetical protein R3P38DRAFT_3460013 [Favolaschia claudopus]|uniref:Uncharacterized protein n=1 Tax=Favolaschia claudopus TaxID=2862362 RepID=A0AAV9ZGS0_9AGAR